MTAAEAELMISLYLHFESHRLGPLWPTIDAQAAAARDRLLSIVTAAGSAGSRTDINITVAARDTSVSQCRHHVFDPAPPGRTPPTRARWAFTRSRTPTRTGARAWKNMAASTWTRS